MSILKMKESDYTPIQKFNKIYKKVQENGSRQHVMFDTHMITGWNSDSFEFFDESPLVYNGVGVTMRGFGYVTSDEFYNNSSVEVRVVIYKNNAYTQYGFIEISEGLLDEIYNLVCK